ncbi:MAG: RNA polymerase sigma factor [Acidimicrobiales bacterium]
MRPDEQDLRKLLTQAMHGDGEAYDEFYRRTVESVARYVRRFLPDSAVADCIQEVYLRLWQTLPRYDPEHSSLTWLFMLAHRSIVDHARKLSSRRDIPTGTLPDGVAPPDHHLSEVSQITLALPPELRTVLLLSAVLGFHYDEIAEIVDCPVGTVRSRLHAARKRMAAQLDEPSTTAPRLYRHSS